MATAAAMDAHQYAAALRNSLLEDLFDGEGSLDDTEGADADASGAYGDLDAAAAAQLTDVDKELEQFANHEVIRDILDRGQVLKEYTRDIDEKLRGVELESIQDYIQESDNLVALHQQIQSCDAILDHMEGLLGRFQGDLGRVSDEIRALQVQSQTMSTKLKNRRAMEDRLGRFVEQLALPEELLDEDYLEHLLALDRKLQFLSNDTLAAGSAARRDVEAVADKLRIKAITKVREFLLSKLYQLRKPKTNTSIIQQSVLLKYKYCVRFLREHAPDVHAELRTEYISVLSRVLAAHFKTYLGAMEKMQTSVAGPSDLLGAPDPGTAGVGVGSSSGGVSGGALGSMGLGAAGNMVSGLFGGAKAQGRPTTEHLFELGDRVVALREVERPAMIPHMAEFEGKRFPYEVIFRNVHKLLVDTATSEFLFCLDFWEDEGAFRELAAPLVQVVEADLMESLGQVHDVLALLLMIRINGEHVRLMARRRVPCLDDYLDRVSLLLWPRFKVLWDLQQGSIKVGVERALFNGDVGPHFVTRRYAALVASVLTLMAGTDSEDGVFKASSFHEMLERLWGALFDMLLRMSNMFKDRRQGIVFLVLNYNHINVVLRGADSAAAAAAAGGPSSAATVASSDPARQQQHPTSPTSPTAAPSGALGAAGATASREVEEQLASCTGLYVEDQLGAHFKALVEFVKKAEQTQKRLGVAEGQVVPGYGPAEAAPMLRDFSARWTTAIDAMHKEVVQQFAAAEARRSGGAAAGSGSRSASAGCGREVLQATMTQLLLYYTRALELLKRQGPPGAAAAREAVTIASIMYEIKRITKT